MADILSEAQTVVDRIVEHCKPEKVILFGSLAHGEGNAGSDIDLLIVKDSQEKRPFRVKEIFEAVRDLDRSYPLDPIVYTPDEINRRLALGDYFIREVLEQGRVMYRSQVSA